LELHTGVVLDAIDLSIANGFPESRMGFMGSLVIEIKESHNMYTPLWS